MIVHDFFIIFASCVMFVVLLNPDQQMIKIQDLRNAMLCSIAASLPTLILYYPRECPLWYEKFRIILHFIVVEVIVAIFSEVLNWVYTPAGKVIMAIEVAVIYAIIKAFSYRGDKKTADQINEKLKRMKEEEKELEEKTGRKRIGKER